MTGEALVFRPPLPKERALIDRLLRDEFPGREALCLQADRVKVATIDADGSLALITSSPVKADVISRIPTEAYGPDLDGATVYILLHVVDGKMVELEVYRGDAKTVMQVPSAQEIEVMCPPFQG